MRTLTDRNIPVFLLVGQGGQHGGGVGAVSNDGRLPEGARVVDTPTLEEAYLGFMAARGRVEAAIVEEES